MTTSVCHNNHEMSCSWPVRVYRKTTTQWQRLEPRHPKTRRKVRVHVTVRGNHDLTLPRLQVRLRIRPTPAPTQGEPTHAAANNNNTKNTSVVVTRRHKCLTVVTGGQQQQPTQRILLLQFQTIADCLACCQALQPTCFLLETTTTTTTTPGQSRTKAHPPQDEVQQQQQQQQEDHSHAVRATLLQLLLDPDFGRFCQRLESQLVSSLEGRHLLQALVLETKDDETNHQQQQQQGEDHATCAAEKANHGAHQTPTQITAIQYAE